MFPPHAKTFNKIAFIIISSAEDPNYMKNLIKEIRGWKLKQLQIYEIENIRGIEGYAHGVNKGIRKGLDDGADLFIVANPDISIEEMTPQNLLSASAHFDIWGFALQQNNRKYYGGMLDGRRLSGGLSEEKPRTRFSGVDFPSGSFMCFTRDVVESVGMWDERYFLYYDEVDYCWRSKQKGFRIGIDSAVSYKHFELSRSNPQKDFYLARGRLMFFMRFGSLWQKLYETARLPKTIIEERKLLFEYIRRRPFLLNFLSLNMSSVINRLFTFILFLFLIRLLKVSEYGMYSLLWAYVGIVTPLSDFGTTSYGVVRQAGEKKEHFNSLFTLRMLFLFIVLVASFPFVFLWKTNYSLLGFFALPILVSNVFSGSSLIFFTSINKTYIASALSVIFNFALVVSAVGFLLTYKNIYVLFWVLGVVYLLYALVNVWFLIIRFKIRTVFNKDIMIKIVKGSFPFALLTLFAGLYFKTDVFLLNYFKGANSVGVYSAGYKFFEALMFLGSSYTVAASPVFLRHYIEESKDFEKKIYRDVPLLFLLGGVIAIAGFLFSPMVLPIFLTHEFAESIYVFRIVIFALPLILTTTIFFSVLYVMKKTWYVLSIFIFQLFLNIILNITFIPIYSYRASAYITVLSEAINVILAIICFKMVYEYRSRRRSSLHGPAA